MYKILNTYINEDNKDANLKALIDHFDLDSNKGLFWTNKEFFDYDFWVKSKEKIENANRAFMHDMHTHKKLVTQAKDEADDRETRLKAQIRQWAARGVAEGLSSEDYTTISKLINDLPTTDSQKTVLDYFDEETQINLLNLLRETLGLLFINLSLGILNERE